MVPEAQLGGRLDYGQPVCLLPVLVSPQQESLDGLFVLACCQFLISKAAGQVDRSIVISVSAKTTDRAAERLLVGSEGAIAEVAARTLLRGVGRLDRVGGHSAFGGGPGDLLRDMC